MGISPVPSGRLIFFKTDWPREIRWPLFLPSGLPAFVKTSGSGSGQVNSGEESDVFAAKYGTVVRKQPQLSNIELAG